MDNCKVSTTFLSTSSNLSLVSATSTSTSSTLVLTSPSPCLTPSISFPCSLTSLWTLFSTTFVPATPISSFSICPECSSMSLDTFAMLKSKRFFLKLILECVHGNTIFIVLEYIYISDSETKEHTFYPPAR